MLGFWKHKNVVMSCIFSYFVDYVEIDSLVVHFPSWLNVVESINMCALVCPCVQLCAIVYVIDKYTITFSSNWHINY